jgi:DNA-directed RNA polymerase subunit RPC12/RpoP
VTPTVTFPCARCRAPLERDWPSAGAAAPCERCAAPVELDAEALRDGRLVGCPACRGTLLYQQKDFRAAIGIAVVAVAAVLAPFTWYLSLVAAALIDLLLYRVAGDVVICYRIACRAHVRGVPAGPKVGAFDLSIHDHQRALARREAAGLAGPGEEAGPPRDGPAAQESEPAARQRT